MKALIVACLAALVLSTQARADHLVAMVEYCVGDGGRVEMQLMELYDVRTREKLGSWTMDTMKDPETGVNAYLRSEVGEGWKEHKTTMYKQVVEKCERKMSL